MQKTIEYIASRLIGLHINFISFFYPKKALNIAYKYFSHPKNGKLNLNKLPKSLQDASLKSIKIDNETYQSYEWKGNENTVLLVHGWESNASRWKKLLPKLKKTGYTIVAVDAPAHGLSDGKEFTTNKYVSLINQISNLYQAKIIIGHSLGGAAIVHYLHKHPDSPLKKAVLMASPSDFEIISRNFVKNLGLNKTVSKLFNDFFVDNFNVKKEELYNHLLTQNITQKALLIYDKNDTVVLINEGHKFSNSWKNSFFVETEDFGHSLNHKFVFDKIIEFIST